MYLCHIKTLNNINMKLEINKLYQVCKNPNKKGTKELTVSKEEFKSRPNSHTNRPIKGRIVGESLR